MLQGKLILLHLMRAILKLVYRLIISWKQAWDSLFRMISKIIHFLFSRYIFIFFAFVLAFIFYQHRVEIFNPFNEITCRTSDIVVKVYVPHYHSLNDMINFHIIVRNPTDNVANNTKIGITSNKDLWFPDGNILPVRTLDAYSVQSGNIQAQLASFLSPRTETNMSVFIQNENEHVTFCKSTITLETNRWHDVFVKVKNAPASADSMLKLLGYVTALITATLALSGKWKDFLKKFDKWATKHDA